MLTANDKQTTVVYFKGGKAPKKYVKITRENLFHRIKLGIVASLSIVTRCQDANIDQK